MFLTPIQFIAIMLAIAAGTQLTRWIPFLLFPENKQPPAAITYLSHVLPPAMMGLLVIYCLKDVSLFAKPYGIPEAASILLTVLLHRWKGNVLLSIAGGTILYMIFVQVIFV